MATEIHYRRFDGPAEQIQELVLPMCVSSFVDFDPDYLCSRLPLVGGIRLWLTSVGEELIGFKLGYEREPRLFYSWLGAVHADFRARGVASRLMKRQHDELVEGGMRFVETRTRANNAAMIIVNLKNGFRIVGFEVDTTGRSIVWQRKTLGEALAPATTGS